MTPDSSKSPESRVFMLAADVDDTLVPITERPLSVQEQGRVDLEKLARALRVAPHLVGLGTATGNSLADHDSYIIRSEFGAFIDVSTFKITSVGTALYRRVGNDFLQDSTWPPPVDGWRRPEIEEVMNQRAELESTLAAHGVAAQINYSSGQFLDFLPAGVHKGAPYKYIVDSYAAETGIRPLAIASDNSMNGAELLAAADFAIVPGNADDSLKAWTDANIREKTYRADGHYADGILEGLHYAGSVGLISFP